MWENFTFPCTQKEVILSNKKSQIDACTTPNSVNANVFEILPPKKLEHERVEIREKKKV